MTLQDGNSAGSPLQERAADAGEQISTDVSTAWDTVDGLIDGFVALLPKIVIALVVLALFLLAARVAQAIIRRVARGDAEERSNAGRVLGRLARLAIVVAGVLVAVSIVAPGVGVTELMALVGAGGVAFAFALQDILQNYVAGLLILLRKPFRIGDQIVAGDYEGTVRHIETRSTIIRTYDGRRVAIPNSEIYANPVEVNTAYEARRTQYDVGIGYGDDAREAARVMLEAVEEVEGVLRDPVPDVIAMELAGSSVNLRARWWTRPKQAGVIDLNGRVILAIKEALDAAGIDMPYPTRVTLFHDQTEALDGDRECQREGWPAGDQPPEARTVASALHELAEHRGDGESGTPPPAS